MGAYLDTRGKTTLAIGICGRCSRKFSLDDLYSDPNYPGLKVCRADVDEYDPYRLPARREDRIVLPFTRPDDSVTTQPSGLITEDGTQFVVSEDGTQFIYL